MVRDDLNDTSKDHMDEDFLTVTIEDRNDPVQPITTFLSTPEDVEDGTIIGRLKSSDEDHLTSGTLPLRSDPHVYALTSAYPNFPFVLRADGTVVADTSVAAIDYEQQRLYEVEVYVHDSGGPLRKDPEHGVAFNLTIAISDMCVQPLYCDVM